jgi:glycosyltransferase involved in cell wall biosynthesis
MLGNLILPKKTKGRDSNGKYEVEKPLVSVLIPTFNSGSTLGSCVDSVAAQTYCNLEIIVIDNYSLDNTREIAKNHKATVLTKGPERSAQMNYGVSVAKGKYILRVDSDMILDRNLVEKCLNVCLTGADAIVVPVLPHPNGPNNFWVSCRTLEQKMLLDDMVNVAPRFIDRQIFIGISGYDETIVAWEDYDLHNRLLKIGCKTVSLTDSAMWHLGESSSLRQVVIKMVYYGKTGSLGLFTKKHGLSGLKQISIVRPSFFRHRDCFVSDPAHYTGIFVMKIIQTFSVALGALSRQLE